MMTSRYGLATAVLTLLSATTTHAFAPGNAFATRMAPSKAMNTQLQETNQNVEQTEDTKRDEIMTFSYDMSTTPKYEKPTYPGTGNGLSGE